MGIHEESVFFCQSQETFWDVPICLNFKKQIANYTLRILGVYTREMWCCGHTT